MDLHALPAEQAGQRDDERRDADDANHVPWKAPIAAPTTIARMIAQYHVQSLLTIAQPTSAELRIITEPTDRSISPSISTSTIPTASVPVTPIWRIRFERLRALRNVDSFDWK